MSQMELKFVNNSYFKKLFQNLRPKLNYSKNIIFVTSHLGTLFSKICFVYLRRNRGYIIGIFAVALCCCLCDRLK